jgi:hypothetical protein
MWEKLVNIFSKIIEGGIILLVFLLPLFFLPITTESFEFPKQILLFFFVSFLTIVWVIKMIIERSVKILQSPLTLPILLFFGIFVLATVFSVHRFSSIFGSYPRFHGGLISLIIYLLFFFLVAANIKNRWQISRILFALLLSGLIIAVIGLANFFDFYFLGDFLRNPFLTPAGSADSTSLFLALILPILILTFFFEKRKILWIFSGIVSLLFIFYIFLISHLAAVLSVFLVFLLAILFSQLKLSREMAIRGGIFFLLCLFLLTINNWDFVRSKTPFLKERPIQHDIVLNQNTGWAIATGGVQNLKLLFLGSGPGTYLFDFSRFKPAEFNQTPFWNFRFEKSSNEYFQIISTLGLLGLLAFLYLLMTAGRMGKEFFTKEGLEKKEEGLLGKKLFSVILLFAFISFFSASFTLTAWLFWLFLGLFLVALNSLNFGKVREVELSLATVQLPEKPKTKQEVLPWVIGIIIVLILAPLLWQEIRILRAELHFSKAQLERLKEQPNIDLILGSLEKARDIMPANDFYRRSLSATSLNLAILGKQQKLLSKEAEQRLSLIAEQEGQLAVQLAPHNIFNWENLQQVYTLVTIENNDEILINTIFPQEIALDPLNPRHYNDWGWIYFAMRNEMEMAKDYFRTAIKLKPDFPDAHYNLARVYKEEEKEDKALQEYEQTLSLLNQQIAFLEPISSARPDLQRSLNQLKQLEAQIKAEKDLLLRGAEAEKEQPSEGETAP